MGNRLSRSSGSRGRDEVEIVRILPPAPPAPAAPAAPAALAAPAAPEAPVAPVVAVEDEALEADGGRAEQEAEACDEAEEAAAAEEQYRAEVSETERLYKEREERERKEREERERKRKEEAKEGEEPTSEPSDGKKEGGSEQEAENTCSLCSQEKENVYALLTCGHRICLDCAFDFLGMAMPEREEVGALQCPCAACDAPIALEDIKAALLLFGSKLPGEKSKALKAEKGQESNEETENDRNEESGERKAETVELAPANPLLDELRSSVGTFSVSLTKSLEMFIADNDNIVRCPNKKCGNLFERISGGEPHPGHIIKDDKGKPLSASALAHYDDHRFRCRLCDVVFCAQCGSFPYHLGYTCKQFVDALTAKKCRYCDVSLPESAAPFKAEGQRESWVAKWRRKRAEAKLKQETVNLGEMTKERRNEVAQERMRRLEAAGEFFVCNEAECMEKAKNACGHTTKCLHLCGGVKGESQCLRCLKEECCEEGQQTADDYCNICWVESLGDAPCAQLKCGHVFHHACLAQKLREGYPTPYISFAFATCPLCDERIEHECLDTTELRELEQKVRQLAELRLKAEMMEGDDELKEGGRFFGRPADYGMSCFTFYKCHQCKEPYYGGKKACGDGADEAAGAFNKEDLLCSKCSGLNANCPVHNQDFIEFKCRFCCSLATFFCGGLAHFCTPCHDRAGEFVDFGNWATKPNVCGDCPGPGKCPLGGMHAPNGVEYAMGCSMCRAMKQKEADDRKEKEKKEKKDSPAEAAADDLAPPPGQ